MALVISINPDWKKIGLVYKDEESGTTKLFGLNFFQVQDYLTFVKNNWMEIVVVIDGHWKKKNDWHKKMPYSNEWKHRQFITAGRDMQIGMMLIELCEKLKLDYKVIKKTKKPMSALEFREHTGVKAPTNVQNRQAYLLLEEYYKRKAKEDETEHS